MEFNLDCRYFIGEKPCKYNRLCEGCPDYDPFGKKVLIIKLGAMGDVIRTTPILPIIVEKFKKVHLTWLVDRQSRIFLRNNPLIDRVIEYGAQSCLRLQIERFDYLFSIDKEVRAAALATIVSADNKFGFGFNKIGNIYPFTDDAHYSLALGMCDELKFFKNKKTYQRDMLDSMGFAGEEYGHYELPLHNFDLNYGKQLLSVAGGISDRYIIGLNTGAGDRFATKRYTEKNLIKLIREITKNLDAVVLLLGGPDEKERNGRIMVQCKDVDNLIDAGCGNPMDKFVGILNVCDIIVSTDTLALHLALALKKRTIALFGSTCNQEIDMYGLGEQIVSRPSCSPCYKNECPNSGDEFMRCMKDISADKIIDSIKRQLPYVNQSRNYWK
ncbi:glycosyltransferase family 9 protein [bacterium]|nr:glycosyltransferase family 9 protein [bacterium]